MKKRLVLTILFIAALSITATVAFAAPAFAPNEFNDIYFNNAENWVDVDNNQEINEGDYFYGILHVQNIDGRISSTLWNEDNVEAGGLDTFTGYFLTTVTGVTVHGVQPHITLGPFIGGADPNGILTVAEIANGVVLKMWTDSATKWTDFVSIATDIANSTDTTPWATFTTNGGYWYTHAPLQPPVGAGNSVGSSFLGLKVVDNSSGLTFGSVNDPNELEIDLNVDFTGQSEIEVGDNHWAFQSNDPVFILPLENCCIDIEKEVSLDGGFTWYDADTVAEAPNPVIAPSGALYRLIVRNDCTSPLDNVVISDVALGVNYDVGTLVPFSGDVIFTSGQIPALSVAERCAEAGQYDNTAHITGECRDIANESRSDSDMAWIVCEDLVPGACRMTGGHVTTNWEYIPGTFAEVESTSTKGGGKKQMKAAGGGNPPKWYTVGGQVGAPSANNPSTGHWTHTQHAGFEGSFTFNAGTASAPPGTEISTIVCADEGWCVQARCAGSKQIFWDGIGIFRNEKGYSGAFPGCTVTPGVTLHYFKAHVGDFGENNNKNRQISEQNCGWTTGGLVGWSAGVLNLASVNLIDAVPDPQFGDKGGDICDECPDYYEIEIHCTTDPNSPVIYYVGDFIDGGNLQIHPEVGQQCPFK